MRRLPSPSIPALIALLVLLLTATGCSGQLLGTNDAVLEYAVESESSPEALRNAIRARLGAAQVTADVEPMGADRVRVVVDQDSTGVVDDLLRWRGGLAFQRVDPTFFFAPEDVGDLRLVSVPLPNGETERYYEGPVDSVRRAVAQAKPPSNRAVLTELLSTDRARTRVVVAPALLELTDSITALETTDYGRALAVTFAAPALERVQRMIAENSGSEVAIVRGRALLETRPVAELAHVPLVLSFGKDIYAFTRAHRTDDLLRTPTLPVLRRVRAERLPNDLWLAGASVVLPLLLSFGWLFFVRQFDRARPEPMWLVLATFALGGLGVIPAGLLEYGFLRASPYLDPTLMTFGGQLASFPIALVVFTLVVGFSEEGSKLLGAWALARHRREFDEPVDGIVYGCASALGFAAIENIKYFAIGRLSGTLVASRSFMSVPAHMFFGAIWGYALGKGLVSKRTSVFLFFVFAAVAHGAFDTFLSIDGLASLGIVLNVLLGVLFLTLLRKALRHGSVADDFVRAFTFGTEGHEEAPASTDRVSFRMGSHLAFVTSATCMLGLAFLLMVLGAAYETLHRRVGIVFVGLASTVLGLFGVAAWMLTQSIPLDAVVDARGLTYAGVLTPWSAILGVRPSVHRARLLGPRAWLDVHTARGNVRLGPATPNVVRRLAEMLDTRR